MIRPDNFTIPKHSIGNTTNDYVEILDWDVRNESKKTLLLKNTGENNLDFCVFSKAVFNGDIEYQDESTSLSPDSVFRAVYNDYQAEIRVLVKSSESDSHTTYKLEYGALIDR